MICPLCSHEFNTTASACHPGCPLGSHCNLICCPNCGYQMVDESKSRFANFLRRLWAPSGRPKDLERLQRDLPAGELATVPLTHISVGTVVEVHRLADMSPKRLTRLSAFGLVPGSRVEILQSRPVPVIRIGETELALSQEILDQIWVRPPGLAPG